MPRKAHQYLLNRDGRFFARLVVPKELRPFIDGKTELRRALGPDRQDAIRKLPGAVALLQHEIALAERRAIEAGDRKIDQGRYPLAVDQIALRNYQSRLSFDELLRSRDARYASVGVDDVLVTRLRDGIAGRLTDGELAELVGGRIERYRRLGNTTASFGTDDWRALARGMCVSEYEALSRVAERDEGDFGGQPTHPLIAQATLASDERPPVSIKTLFADYIAAKQIVGKGMEADRRWGPVFADLRKTIGHDDARRLTKQNLIDWRDARLKTHSAKTVADVYLAAVRTVLSWALANDRLEVNVAAQVRQEVPKRQLDREKGFTLAEATIVLRASRTYAPAIRENHANSEAPQTTAAKQWAPILCAFTGARVAEITQLRKQDIRTENGATILRITPKAGTVKAGGYRDVPIHPQVLELGFLDFVRAAADGPLFYIGRSDRSPIKGARAVAGRVSQWLQSRGVVPVDVDPNHGWRHRFKSVGLENGVAERVIDAIQGHAGRTAGENYGDITLKTRIDAIYRLPNYDI
ncbi:MAG: tyrosine-type recombinase/integrase [Bosea sp. (in: a-proteobacteria)]|uniref:tyrosine-type recombinase/integrase n=1 Tax=Bosea sp. (in: a-proteobacteria) TaxID=1871050 RepID=UPI002734126E|nr:tyrosine-type recombinase/integrase [Bosea sp. (in: a-proteobacteria)]MDP3600059.1 tyrosine-type recombinase/integrase [Bosea sp. (in: a-proteobacteria)]